MAAGLLPIILLGGIAAAAAAMGGKKKAAAPPTSGTFTLDHNLPPQLEQQTLGAIATATDPNQLLFLGSQMDAMGYHLTAAALRKRAAELQAVAAAAAPPIDVGPPAAPPAGGLPALMGIALDANIDPATRAAVMQALASETDPAKLSGFAAAIQLRYPMAAALLLAKAATMQIAAPIGAIVTAPRTAPTAATVPSAAPAVFDPSQLAPGHSIRALLNAEEWRAVLTLLNDWLRENYTDPGVSFIDLSFWRDNIDDLQVPADFELAVDALQALANQKGYSVPPNLPGSQAGVLDGQTFATLLNWASTHGHPIPTVLAPIALTIQSALAGVRMIPGAAAAAPPFIPGLPPMQPVAQPGMPTVPGAPVVPPTGAPAPLAPIVSLRDVQHALNLLHVTAIPLVEDNLNGPKTIAAVKTFQSAHGLKVDGVAGPQTKAALQAALAGGAPGIMPTPILAIPGVPGVPGLQPAISTIGTIATLKDVQHALNLLHVTAIPLVEDNLNGPKTIAAVKTFQSAHGLKVDGVAGPQTKAMLVAALAAGAIAPIGLSAPAASPAPLAALPSGVASLKDVQHALNLLGGPGTPLVEDGKNGPKTTAAVKAFQAAHGLKVDGLPGPQTQGALQAALAAITYPAGAPAAAPGPAPLAVVRTIAAAAPLPIATLRDVQHALNLLHVTAIALVEDNLNGPKTIVAVKAFQSAHGLKPDGIAGPQTKSMLQMVLQPLARTA